MPTEFLLRFEGANGSTTFTDSSSNNRTFTRSGSPIIWQSQENTSQSVGNFPGQTSYITTPNDSGLEIRNSAFTFRLWIYPYDATGNSIYSRSGTYGVAYEIAFFWDTTYLYFYHGIRGINQSQIRWPLNGKLQTGRWNHLVWQRDGSGAWYAFIDGIELTQYQYAPLNNVLNFGSLTTGRLTNTVDLGSNSIRHRIHGFDAGTLGGVENSFYDDVELIIGSAEYSGNFTPPTKPPDPVLQIHSITPNTGYSAGGSSFTVVGRAFNANTTIYIGGNSATNLVISNSQYITGRTPPHDIGYVDVVVTNP